MATRAAPRSNYHHLARLAFRHHVGADLDTWLLERRRPMRRGDPPTSWRRIAAELEYLTDGDVSPAVQTLITWHDDAAHQAQAVAA